MASYLSNADYISKYGEAETKRLTDEAKTGSIDTEKLTEALEDGTVVVESYIGQRYQTPVASPPRLLQTFVGALAREALHKSQKPDAVVEDADRARSQLKDIARGIMTLPIPTGGTAPIETAGYTAFGNLGYNANWKA